jgi:integrase
LRSGRIYLKKLRAGDVTDFLLHDSSNRGQRSVQLTATVLRSFLNFLFQKRRIATNLAAVVPSVPHRRLAELPHYLERREVERVLRSCDRRRKIGKRDYAIFLLLARLGLRAGEVAQLTLEDIDWRAGELLVRGKGARVDRLPLLGYKLKDAEFLLRNFVRFIEQEGSDVITAKLAVRWSARPNIKPAQSGSRLSVVGRFAAYVSAHDARTEVPALSSVVAAEMRAIELDALHGGIGCGLGGA